jgi:integrase
LIRECVIAYKPYKEVFKGQALDEAEEAIYFSRITAPDHRDFALILIDTAIEPGVVAALRWEDVQFNPAGKRYPRGFIHARGTKYETRDRNVPMSARLKAGLQERFFSVGRPTRGYVFPAERLGPSHHTAENAFRQMHAQLWEGPRPVPLKFFRLYDLRHTALTRLVKTTGGNLFVLQKIAGWVNTRMAERYIHLDEQVVSDAMDKFNQHLEDAARN